jgi:hypothetical protein
MSKEQLPERPELDESLKNTDAHQIISNMGYIPDRLVTVPDLENGGERCKRYGAWMGVNILPYLNEQVTSPNVPLILPEPPPVLVIADTLKELRDRLVFEIDVMVGTVQEIMDGKIAFNEQGLPVKVDPDENNTEAETNLPHIELP